MALDASTTGDASGGSTQGQLVGFSWRPIALGAVRKRTLACRRLSQKTLAQNIGTTRPRVKAFMNKNWQLGFLDYTGSLMFYRGLLSVTVRD